MGRGKYTEQEALNAQPEPTTECPIVRVLGPRGQNLHEVAVARSLISAEINKQLNPEDAPWFTTLVQLPPKFRNVVWVKRGSYVLADLSEQLTDKIGGEVALVLLAAQVKYLKQSGMWPAEYEGMWAQITGNDAPASKDRGNSDSSGDDEEDSDDEEESDDGFLGGNPNRQYIPQDSSSDEDEDEDEA
ncbi:hypothetical protein GGI07_003729 [Coemansia sp. Benny D115]|nr:hypothetical protein GGI07_003729 [Coemansia sp. Benny D115]